VGNNPDGGVGDEEALSKEKQNWGEKDGLGGDLLERECQAGKNKENVGKEHFFFLNLGKGIKMDGKLIKRELGGRVKKGFPGVPGTQRR